MGFILKSIKVNKNGYFWKSFSFYTNSNISTQTDDNAKKKAPLILIAELRGLHIFIV
ncbi:hypothetical protein HMPREF0556_11515 [Listeria grayi DSM 20601]|uniref:Uncharacterized protein n=1 Tax=Listeria grayi DSM 20601 TaxID=525367 RepID=D7UZI5_LISGR|nr:hypothetical protein HMPREF0556_11515 [Listeria grayi DSM 20601]